MLGRADCAAALCAPMNAPLAAAPPMKPRRVTFMLCSAFDSEYRPRPRDWLQVEAAKLVPRRQSVAQLARTPGAAFANGLELRAPPRTVAAGAIELGADIEVSLERRQKTRPIVRHQVGQRLAAAGRANHGA